LLWAILYHSRRTLNRPSDKAFEDVLQHEGPARTAKVTQVKHPMILFFKRIFPVRFWENSALAAVIFKHWIVRGKHLSSCALRFA
jgi:hypothetical protein